MIISDEQKSDAYIYIYDSDSKSWSVMSDCLWPHGPCSPWNSLGRNTGVGSLSFLQGIFPSQGSDPGLSYWRQILYQMSHKGSPCVLICFSCVWLCVTLWTIAPYKFLCPWGSPGKTLEQVTMPSSRGCSQSRDQTLISYVSCIGRWVLYH